MPTPRPVTHCAGCNHYGFIIEASNNRCGQTVGGNRCKTTVRSALNTTDWMPCPVCNGTGADPSCAACQRTGWIYNRDGVGAGRWAGYTTK